MWIIEQDGTGGFALNNLARLTCFDVGHKKDSAEGRLLLGWAKL